MLSTSVFLPLIIKKIQTQNQTNEQKTKPNKMKKTPETKQNKNKTEGPAELLMPIV